MRFLALLVPALMLGPSVAAQESTLLQTGAVGEGFTADGQRAYGETFLSGPFVWDQASNLIGGNDIVGLNSAGTLAAGNDWSLNPGQASIWTGTTWSGLGGLPGSTGCDTSLSSAWAMSDNDVVVGLNFTNCTQAEAFRWSASGGMVALPTAGTGARANAISADGSTIGGHAVEVGGAFGWHACIWDDADVQTVIGPAQSDVLGFSSDGTFAVGYIGLEPFLWNASTGSVTLPRPASVPAGLPAFAWGVSDDGSIVVGQYGNLFGSIGFVWEAGVGTMVADDYFASRGFVFPKEVQSVTDVTADGRTFLVNIGGWIFGNQDAYRVRLPTAFEDLGFAKNGAYGKPELTATGDLTLGSDIDVDLVNALENTSAYLVIGVAPLYFSPFYGGTLVPAFEAPFGTFLVLPTNGSGEIHLASTWPGGVPSGTDLYIQYWIVDGAGVGGFAASNAVHGAVP